MYRKEVNESNSILVVTLTHSKEGGDKAMRNKIIEKLKKEHSLTNDDVQSVDLDSDNWEKDLGDKTKDFEKQNVIMVTAGSHGADAILKLKNKGYQFKYAANTIYINNTKEFFGIKNLEAYLLSSECERCKLNEYDNIIKTPLVLIKSNEEIKKESDAFAENYSKVAEVLKPYFKGDLVLASLDGTTEGKDSWNRVDPNSVAEQVGQYSQKAIENKIPVVVIETHGKRTFIDMVKNTEKPGAFKDVFNSEYYRASVKRAIRLSESNGLTYVIIGRDIEEERPKTDRFFKYTREILVIEKGKKTQYKIKPNFIKVRDGKTGEMKDKKLDDNPHSFVLNQINENTLSIVGAGGNTSVAEYVNHRSPNSKYPMFLNVTKGDGTFATHCYHAKWLDENTQDVEVIEGKNIDLKIREKENCIPLGALQKNTPENQVKRVKRKPVAFSSKVSKAAGSFVSIFDCCKDERTFVERVNQFGRDLSSLGK